MKIESNNSARVFIFLIFAISSFALSQADESERDRLLKWANGQEISTDGTIFDQCFRNLLPKEIFPKQLSLDEFKLRFGIGDNDKIYNGGANGAMYEVYRLSARRLLVCFTIWTYEKQIEMVRLASVIPDTSNGSATTSQLNRQIGNDLEKLNGMDMGKFYPLVLAELRRRKAQTGISHDNQMQQGEQPSAAQSATDPAKPSVNDQPSTPTSKDGPGSRDDQTAPRLLPQIQRRRRTRRLCRPA